MKIAEISIKRPSLIIVLFIILTLGGFFAYTQLGYELVPDMDIKVVTVQTVYPGASPSEVESSVTKKIEDAVSSLENVKKVESKSLEGVSIVMITLTDKANADVSLNEAQRKINAMVNDLPEFAKAPSIVKFSLDDVPIMNLSVTSENLSSKELYELLDQKIQPVFSRIEGVAKVDMIGGQEREIKINIIPDRLKGYGLNINQVQRIIASANMDFPTGNIQTQDNQTTIRLSGKLLSLQELRDLPVPTANGGMVRLSDIAYVVDGTKDVDKISRIDQKNTILLQVYKQSDANAVAVSEQVKKTTSTIEKEYQKDGLKMTVASDSSDYTLKAANHVIKDLLMAILLVAVIMLFFLHSLRDAGITIVAIPLSLIATFIGLYAFGYTLNLMSLLGLSLVVGILVDDAIVVIENIHRHMEMGKNKVRAAYDGAKEIGFTVMGITLVIIVVFLPISLATGLVPNILRQFTVTVMLATGISLLVSFTIVPWLYSRFGKIQRINSKSFIGKIVEGFESGIHKLSAGIGNILEWALAKRSHKLMALGVTVVLFVSSLMLVTKGFVGTDFFPSNDKGEFYLQMELNKDASIEQTNMLTRQAEQFLSQKPGIEKIITTVGQASDGVASTNGSKYKSEIHIFMKGSYRKIEPTKVYAAKLKREIEPVLVDAKIKIVNEGVIGAERAPLAMTIMGTNRQDVMQYANEAAGLLRNIPGATEVRLTSEDGNPELGVHINRDKMNKLGLDIATVGAAMQTAFAGNTDNKFTLGEEEYDMNIRYDAAGRTDIRNIEDMEFTNAQGQPVQLKQFAEIIHSSGPSLLERKDKTAAVTVQAQTVGKSVGTVAAEWETALQKVEKKSGISYVWGGNMENQQEGFGALGIALMASVILVYLVMVAIYNNFATPLIVLFSIPLSFIGALLFLALFNQTLNIFTILGIIMLIGLVAKNAILLVDFAEHSKARGMSTHDALLAAFHTRFRPILMTTIAMVIGMMPIAFATGVGAEMNRGLALVIIGGLLSSLFLTLVIIPVIYSIFDGIKARIGKKKSTDYAELINEDYSENPNFAGVH